MVRSTGFMGNTLRMDWSIAAVVALNDGNKITESSLRTEGARKKQGDREEPSTI